ncbi:hypothetical protein T4B_8590, partial [Trichinella pseudospiralis]
LQIVHDRTSSGYCTTAGTTQILLHALKYLAIPEIKNTKTQKLRVMFIYSATSLVDQVWMTSPIGRRLRTALLPLPQLKLVQRHQKKTSIYAASLADKPEAAPGAKFLKNSKFSKKCPRHSFRQPTFFFQLSFRLLVCPCFALWCLYTYLTLI